VPPRALLSQDNVAKLFVAALVLKYSTLWPKKTYGQSQPPYAQVYIRRYIGRAQADPVRQTSWNLSHSRHFLQKSLIEGQHRATAQNGSPLPRTYNNRSLGNMYEYQAGTNTTS
jgi:hypothetical protein